MDANLPREVVDGLVPSDLGFLKLLILAITDPTEQAVATLPKKGVYEQPVTGDDLDVRMVWQIVPDGPKGRLGPLIQLEQVVLADAVADPDD